jgi:hypothetical protein
MEGGRRFVASPCALSLYLWCGVAHGDSTVLAWFRSRRTNTAHFCRFSVLIELISCLTFFEHLFPAHIPFHEISSLLIDVSPTPGPSSIEAESTKTRFAGEMGGWGGEQEENPS